MRVKDEKSKNGFLSKNSLMSSSSLFDSRMALVLDIDEGITNEWILSKMYNAVLLYYNRCLKSARFFYQFTVCHFSGYLILIYLSLRAWVILKVLIL